jgi:hypothetical protein
VVRHGVYSSEREPSPLGSEHELTSLSPAPEPSLEGRLVAAAWDGDRTAFGRLYERYAPMVHGLLLARVPRADVDDLACV